jgi:tetratricopeptide (TPR) repeat protein
MPALPPSLLLTAALAAQTAPAPLPALPFDTYPGAMREAVRRAHTEAAARPADAAATGALARLLHAWEQWDAAHQAYARAQSLAPAAFEWRYLDGAVLQRLARQADAAAQLERALAVDRESVAARARLADALFESGKLERSQALYAELVGLPAAEPIAHFGLGRIAAAQGHHEDAVAELQKAVALFPEFGAAHYALALSLRALGRRDEAQQALLAHARHGAAWPAVPDRLLDAVAALRDDAGASLRRGLKRAQSGDVPGAIAEYEAALAKDPSLAVAHANLVRLYGGLKVWDKAEAHHEAALQTGADPAESHYDHGVLLSLQERWEPAAEAYQRAIAADPLHAEALNNLGQLRERARGLDEALGLYQRAVAARPTFRLARFNAGRMLIALGRPAEAAVEFAKIVEPRDAEAPRYLFALSVAYVRSGQREEGKRWAEDARRLALDYGQAELAAAIERDLASLK